MLVGSDVSDTYLRMLDYVVGFAESNTYGRLYLAQFLQVVNRSSYTPTHTMWQMHRGLYLLLAWAWWE